MTDVKFTPRQLLDKSNQTGYLESDKDFVLNNIELCVKILETIEFFGSVSWVDPNRKRGE